MKMNKKGVAGEGILMVYRLVLIGFIALIILGLAAVFYDYYIDVRGTEAMIMTREVVNCVAPSGVVDLTRFENGLLEVCGFDSGMERFYVRVDVGGEILEQGDSGVEWVKEIFENEDKVEAIKKYGPGYFEGEYNVLFNGEEKKMKVEVLVSHEF